MNSLEIVSYVSMGRADWLCLAKNFKTYTKVAEIVGCSASQAKRQILAVGGFAAEPG